MSFSRVSIFSWLGTYSLLELTFSFNKNVINITGSPMTINKVSVPTDTLYFSTLTTPQSKVIFVIHTNSN